MSKYYLGVDLGSTTSKAIIINEYDEIIGRGITNTRANYSVATEISQIEAVYNARFSLLKMKLKTELASNPDLKNYLTYLESVFAFLLFKKRLDRLKEQLLMTAKNIFKGSHQKEIVSHISTIIDTAEPQIREDFINGSLGSRNQFFRDIIGEKYHEEVEKLDKELFEPLMITYDKSITPVENELTNYAFKDLVFEAIEILNGKYAEVADSSSENTSMLFDAEINLLQGNYIKVSDSLLQHIKQISAMEIAIANMVGTGYGRALLPFAQESIKSEIMCHAFGAHAVFPKTRTVLDIGGQDTKAIQVDSQGLVTSFHMNDRCAAGCGRYLGYIADEFNISLNELGPLALEADKEVNICSTCTVFAGAEVRELLNVGEKRSDILAGLHKAIVMRAMSLIARSGGVNNEFTFTGGVARNKAVLNYVSSMVLNSYGKDITINVHPDSIFMGALGGAMFARRSVRKNILANN